MGTDLGLHGQEEHGPQYDMSCDNRENDGRDLCDSNTNSIDILDNHIRSKPGKLIDDLVSNIKLTTLASQTKLDSFSSPCELCDYDRDMAVQIKKHVESMHIDLVHTFRSATKREHTFVFRLHISQHRGAARDDLWLWGDNRNQL